jgi:hypothetical protein
MPVNENKYINPDTFYVGERVQSHPATDRWMMGDRFGSVVKIGSRLVHVKMDRSGRTIKYSANNLLHMGD